MNNNKLWVPVQSKELEINDINDAVSYSDDTNLTPQQKQQILLAFNAGAFDMATGYTWNRAIVKLKEALNGLGGDFIGAMLKRYDINEFTPIVEAISDTEAISLSESLGILSTEASMHLRQAKEQLNFYFSTKASQEGKCLNRSHALPIIEDCVKYILSVRCNSTEIPFNSFKDRLLGYDLTVEDKEYKMIETAPLFYLRTVCTILLTTIRKDSGAKLEHALSNINLLIPNIWSRLGEDDKWNIGNVYKDVAANGNETAAKGLRSALKKVRGFDYVPENIRSMTFIAAAQHLLNVHYEFNNFYNEYPAARALASLGSIIPKSAFMQCVKAYLCVIMGNYYGVSNKAAKIAREELGRVQKDRWQAYFNSGINNDDDVLNHFQNKNQFNRLRTFLINYSLADLDITARNNLMLYSSIINDNYETAKTVASSLYYKIRGQN